MAGVFLSACNMSETESKASTPPPAASRAEEIRLYQRLCISAAQSGDFTGLAGKFRSLGYKPTVSISLRGGHRSMVRRWEKAGSNIALFNGAADRTANFCAVGFPGTNPATGVNAPLAEGMLWYRAALAALGRKRSAIVTSAPISVTGTNGTKSLLTYQLAEGGMAVYASNF